MPGQAEKLVERMKKESDIDFENDWKVITIFVGGNDLCDFCDNKVGPNKKNTHVPVFRVTQPYLNLLVKHRTFFRFSGKHIILFTLRRHKIIFFPEKIYVPSLPKIFRPVTQNTLIFLHGLALFLGHYMRFWYSQHLCKSI